MKNCLLIISISAVLVGGGCAKSSATSQDASANLENSPAIVQSDGDVNNQNGSLNSTQTFVAETSMNSKFPGVTVMNDGFGNTVEKRFFDNHPRIICVIVRTNADGKKVATVYGHNGDRRQLPEYKIADAFTDGANRLADVAGIWEGRKVEETPLPQFQPVISETLPQAIPAPTAVTKSEETKNEAGETSTNNLPDVSEKKSNQPETKSDPTSLNLKNLDK